MEDENNTTGCLIPAISAFVLMFQCNVYQEPYFLPFLIFGLVHCFYSDHKYPEIMVIPILAPLVTLVFAPWWVALMLYGAMSYLFWGKPSSPTDFESTYYLNRKYGWIFDITGFIIFWGCIIYGFLLLYGMAPKLTVLPVLSRW